MRVSDINPSVDASRWVAVWQALKDKTHFTTETIHRRKDGTEIPVEIASTYVVVGNKEYSCAFSRNITDRKRAAQALSESEARYRALFQKSHDALMTLAPPSWEFTSGNSAAIDMFGARDEADFMSRSPS
jgi:PAS domain-containing protein